MPQAVLPLWIIAMLAAVPLLYSQSDSIRTFKEVDANFLLSYYQQDGQNSAVTGGRGTEELTDLSGTLTLYVPVDSSGGVSGSISVNYYTSASTDKIDSRISSASEDDIRAAWRLGWQQNPNSKGRAYDFSLGGSVESDYISTNLYGSYFLPLDKSQQHALNIDAQAYFDRWVLYFPEELRDTIHPFITTDRRFSYHLNLQYLWVVNRRMQLALSTGLSMQHGLLSTPFHRVYFENQPVAKIERLPSQKWKWPLGIRAHYFLGSSWIIRGFYRFYLDDFGMRAQSFTVELPWKVSPHLTITPLYRYHTQTAVRFFQPFAQHRADATFYTSDFDLSALQTHKMGIGIRLLPYWKWKINAMGWEGQLRSIGVRLTHYRRSDGLSSWAVSTYWGS
jgi:hypothetical protein